MRRAEFDALCRRELEADGGEVTEVTLTTEGLRELANEVLSSPEAETTLTASGKTVAACGGRVSHVVHPITKLAVPFSLGDEDFATVRHGPEGSLARTVAITRRITIEWPNASECAPSPLRGSGAVVRDADTGEPLRTLSLTVTAPGIRVTSTSLTGAGAVFADVTHPATADGRILDRDYGEAGYWDRDGGTTAVRRYEVTRMSEIPAVEPWTAQVNRAGLLDFFRRVREDGGTVVALRLSAGDMRELAYGPGPFVALTFTEDGVTRPERVASTRVTSVENPAARGTRIPVSVAPEGEAATATVRYGPEGSLARTVAIG